MKLYVEGILYENVPWLLIISDWISSSEKHQQALKDTLSVGVCQMYWTTNESLNLKMIQMNEEKKKLTSAHIWFVEKTPQTRRSMVHFVHVN